MGVYFISFQPDFRIFLDKLNSAHTVLCTQVYIPSLFLNSIIILYIQRVLVEILNKDTHNDTNRRTFFSN